MGFDEKREKRGKGKKHITHQITHHISHISPNDTTMNRFQFPRKLLLFIFLNLVVLKPSASFSIGSQDVSSRRNFLKTTLATATTVSTSLLVPQGSSANDADPNASPSNVFTRIKEGQFGYTITLPVAIDISNKPLQTHLDEVNLQTGQKGYYYGITVDPIRIKSLREFGTPNEVAAKIVMAELRRDGVLDVTVGRDPTEDATTGGYDVEYISDGKRGKKHFVTRTIVSDGKLYVLTVQVKEEDWTPKIEKEVFDAVASFKVV
jgi:hypothetical protein